jgi:hypothetical protein
MSVIRSIYVVASPQAMKCHMVLVMRVSISEIQLYAAKHRAGKVLQSLGPLHSSFLSVNHRNSTTSV